MDSLPPEPPATGSGPSAPKAPARVGWWVYGFLVFFLALAASTAYFVAQPVALSRGLDPERSVLVSVQGDAVEARIVVRNVAADGHVRAVPEAPETPGGPWRVVIDWTAAPAVPSPGGGNERTLRVLLPRVDRVDVVDRRGPVAEHMLLRLTPEGGPR